MRLEELGYDATLEQYRNEQELDSFEVGRVVSEHKERYRVRTMDKECDAEIIGNLRYSARERADFPAVGDWVAVSEYDNEKLLIHHVYPRRSVIERSAVGRVGEKQIIAANIDFALIMHATGRDFSENRIERYLAICAHSGITPVILLTKTDLVGEEELKKLADLIEKRFRDHPLVAISNETRSGYKELLNLLIAGKTYCLLGSSGVGKSTLINNLSMEDTMKTGTISESTQRGRHVTSHREMILLRNGAIMIDNPGMREVGITDASDGFQNAFREIMNNAEDCRYKNCTHTHEEGCAVKKAVEEGKLDRDAYLNYLKMKKEQDFFESSLDEKRRRDKAFGKILKDYKKISRKNEEG